MLNKISDRIYFMPDKKETDRPILGLICGEKYSLVVDSGNSPNHVMDFLNEVEKLNVPPLKYLVITHYHWDHTFGIKEMNLTTIGHKKTKDKLNEIRKLKFDDQSIDEREKKGLISSVCSSQMKTELKNIDNFELGDIDITLTDNLEIDLGKLTCVIQAIEGPHTEDSIMVYIPDEKVMFLGDAAYYGRLENGLIGIEKDKLFPMIDIIEKYDVNTYVLSHESLCDREEIIEYWTQLRDSANVVGICDSYEESLKRYINIFNKEPSENEKYYLEWFVNVNK